jgi:Uma2 family endonuclease
MEGSLVMSPSPTAGHMFAVLELAVQIRQQLPAHLRVIPDVDINLELAPPNQPGFSRRPDLIIVDHAALVRVEAEGGLIRASEVLVVIEIVSPGSRRTDNVVKRAEYADAGIPRYWIVDIEQPVSLVACQLTEEFGYQDDEAATNTFSTTEPFAISLDLDRLR